MKGVVMKRERTVTQTYDMKRSVFVWAMLMMMLGSIKVSAQEEFIEPPSRLLSRIPFDQLTGGIILIQAKLDNFPDTLNFVLDTGSSGISLDSTTVAYLKLQPVPTDRTIRGIAGIRKVSFLFNETIHFPGLTIDSLDIHINDYAILTAVYGERIDGIIGYSVLSRYIVKVNYDSSKVEFFSRGTIRYPKGGYFFKPILNTLPIQALRLKDETTVNTRFLFDIGAGLCMMLTSDFVKDSALIKKKKKMWMKQAEGMGGKLDMNLTWIKEVKIGPYRFRKVPVYIFDDIYNVTSYPYLGGLIGNDVLRRFNIILNYEKREIYLLPNSHFNEPFDYSYSGLELYLIDNVIMVGDVAKGSPAEEAGVKEGDVVIAVNKNFSQNLTQYKFALQIPNEKVQLIIKRSGELKQIEVKVKSILQ